MDHAIHIIINMCQFEGWRKVEDGAVDAAVTVCLSSTFCSLKFELGAYVFLCIKGDMDQLVYLWEWAIASHGRVLVQFGYKYMQPTAQSWMADLLIVLPWSQPTLFK